MTEAEALEVAAEYLANCLGAITLYMSVTFAFLTVSYLLGARLPRSEALVISCLYLLTSLSALASFLNANRFYGLALEFAPSQASANPFSDPAVWEIAGTIICILGAVISLYFLWSVRRSPDRE